jgi:hypothetical protein
VLVEQHLEVLGLGEAAARCTGAEHGSEAELGEAPADDLRERGKDRVLQLGNYEADEPGPLAA